MEPQDNTFSPAAVVILVAVSVPFYAVMIWAYVRIIQKAGYSGWSVLWSLVPIVNIVMFFYFAFADWPITKRMSELEQRVFGDAPPPTVGRG